jgi:hypothetical protein
MTEEWSLWGEPVTRPDGRDVKIRISPNEQSILISNGGIAEAYTRSEVEKLGGGNFTAGLSLIGQRIYGAPRSELRPNTLRSFSEEFNDKQRLRRSR